MPNIPHNHNADDPSFDETDEETQADESRAPKLESETDQDDIDEDGLSETSHISEAEEPEISKVSDEENSQALDSPQESDSSRELDPESLNIEEISQQLSAMGIEGVEELLYDRSITTEDIAYLLNKWPFLQMVSLMEAEIFPEVRFVTVKTGWVVHNYGDALSTSPGQLLFGGGNYRVLLPGEEVSDDEGGSGGKGGTGGRTKGIKKVDIINPGKGTLVRQAVETAFEMVQLAKNLNWQGLKIIDGHPLMKWAAWLKAQELELAFEGYNPTDYDLKRKSRLNRSSIEDQKMMLEVKSQFSRG